MAKSTTALVKELYPIVVTALGKNMNKYKSNIGKFVETRTKELYDIAPCDRIYFGTRDLEDFFSAIGIDEKQATSAINNTYYHKIAAFNPRAAKDEFTVTMMMVIRYFYLKKMDKELELASIYLAFSGKFYPSIHYMSFPKVQPSEYRHVMEYVVNTQLSEKYDLKSKGSVFGAVRSICNTWFDTYDKLFRSDDDEDIVYLIQQLHNRIKSFMKNIAELYYKAYADKEYMTYDSDNLDQDSYRLADSDSLKAERFVEKSMSVINTTRVDYKLCKMASDQNVKVEEVKSIIESILLNTDNMDEVKELVRLMIITYSAQSKTKDVRDIEFLTFSITPKPNSKDPNILRQKEIVENWLDEKSPAYRKRKSRLATKNSYHRSVYTYFALVIHNSNK